MLIPFLEYEYDSHNGAIRMVVVFYLILFKIIDAIMFVQKGI